jgi:hypothetical protein
LLRASLPAIGALASLLLPAVDARIVWDFGDSDTYPFTVRLRIP